MGSVNSAPPKVSFFSLESFDGTLLSGQHLTPIGAAPSRSGAAGDGSTDESEVGGESPRPTVVLANGLGGNFLAWQPLTDALGADYDFLSWDYRGLYASGKAPDLDRYLVQDSARDLLEVMDARGLEKAVWAGWSMGVQVVLEAMRLAPERCEALVLLNGTYGRAFHTAFNWRHGRFTLPVLNEIGRIGAPVQSAVIKHAVRWGLARPFFRLMRFISADIDGPLFDRLAQDVATLDLDLFHRMLASLDSHDASDLLHRIEVPTLILAGEADLMTPPQVTERMRLSIPHAHVEILPGATHYMLLEAGEGVARRVALFLEDHLERVGVAA